MQSEAFTEALVAAFGRARVRLRALLAPYTTFRVGGPADWLVEIGSADHLVQAVQLAAQAGVPVTVLGGGSNVLIGDGGIRGLVVRFHGGTVTAPRDGIVRAEGGVTVNGLVRWTLNRGFAGLEAWAGTPGTVGGGLYGNAHFDGRLLGELVDRVRVVARSGEVYDLPAAAMEFGYDRSRLQRTRELVLWADFRVGHGDPAALRAVARRSLAYRKQTQPLNVPSAGCVFQNPDPARDRWPQDIPLSAGAILDRAGLKGAREGGARVSPVHANFIVNEGGATARDIRRLIARCRRVVADRFGVELREEVVYLGEFDAEEPPGPLP
jgi:UDP-N-acetylmuramate dehydrogenase